MIGIALFLLVIAVRDGCVLGTKPFGNDRDCQSRTQNNQKQTQMLQIFFCFNIFHVQSGCEVAIGKGLSAIVACLSVRAVNGCSNFVRFD